jgi:hypothetical protein
MNHPLSSDLGPLVGLKLNVAGHAADMRTFGFMTPVTVTELPAEEWALHIQCPWRMEIPGEIVTGSADWWRTEDGSDPPEDWDPATGGSLQALRLREIFEDTRPMKGPLRNRTERFIVTEVNVSTSGDLAIGLTDGLRICVFPSGCRGEFWRVFKRGSDSHIVCEGRWTPDAGRL